MTVSPRSCFLAPLCLNDLISFASDLRNRQCKYSVLEFYLLLIQLLHSFDVLLPFGLTESLSESRQAFVRTVAVVAKTSASVAFLNSVSKSSPPAHDRSLINNAGKQFALRLRFDALRQVLEVRFERLGFNIDDRRENGSSSQFCVVVFG